MRSDRALDTPDDMAFDDIVEPPYIEAARPAKTDAW
jgi:hypothetical protein